MPTKWSSEEKAVWGNARNNLILGNVHEPRSTLKNIEPQLIKIPARAAAKSESARHPPAVPPAHDIEPTQFDGKKERLLFCTYKGVPRIYEFGSTDSSTGQRRKLLYPPADQREYYLKGDFILRGEISRSDLGKLLPQYQQNPTLFLLMILLGMEEKNYKTAWQIADITVTDATRGRGKVHLRNVVWLDAELPPVDLRGAEMKKSKTGPVPAYRSYDDICTNFIQSEIFGSASVWVTLVHDFTVKFVSTVLGGAFKKLLQKGAASAITAALKKKVSQEVLKEGSMIAVKTSLAFAKTFASAIVKKLNTLPPIDPATQKPDLKAVGIDESFLMAAIGAASLNASSKMFQEIANVLMGKAAKALVPDAFLRDVIGNVEVMGKTLIIEKGLKITPALINTFLSSISDALVQSKINENGKQTLDINLLNAKLEKEFQKSLRIDQDILKAAAGYLVDSIQGK